MGFKDIVFHRRKLDPRLLFSTHRLIKNSLSCKICVDIYTILMGRKTYKKDTIQIDDMQILVSRKRVKNYYLHVTPPDGEVIVTVRVGTSDHDIKRFVEPKREWIKSQIKRFT